MRERISLGSFLLLLVAFIVYSTTGVFSKLASGEAFLSKEYISYFVIVILTMGVYAVLWQLVLKIVPLAQAFLFKSMTVLFSLCFAYFIFSESVSLKNIIGAGFIIVGIIINSKSKKIA